MLMKPSSAFKAIIAAVLFTSVITISCNNSKEAKEPEKTEEAAPAPAAPATNDSTAAEESPDKKPGATGNKEEDAPPAAPSN